MKARAIALTITLCFVVAVCFAADNAFMGTWKLNEAKSKFSPGTGRNTTVVWEAVGDNVKVTQDGTNSEGKPVHVEWLGKLDGKDYPLTGSPNANAANARSVKKINDHTLEITNKKGGKVLTSGRIVVSADGKSRTVTVSGTDSTGNKVSEIEVFDKQ